MSREKLLNILLRIPEPAVTDKSLEERAAEQIYRNEEGRIGLPTKMLRKSLVLAGTKVQLKGKTNVSKADGSTLLYSFLWISEPFAVFENIPGGLSEEEERGKKYWRVSFERGAQTQTRGQKGGAAPIVRPEIPQWEATVTIQYDEKRVNEKTIRALFDEAGLNQGLGSWRPNKGGDHGQFEVVEWTDITDQLAEKVA
jgi:hypothetical protein